MKRTLTALLIASSLAGCAAQAHRASGELDVGLAAVAGDDRAYEEGRRLAAQQMSPSHRRSVADFASWKPFAW